MNKKHSSADNYHNHWVRIGCHGQTLEDLQGGQHHVALMIIAHRPCLLAKTHEGTRAR